jgi:hypothetical protein
MINVNNLAMDNTSRIRERECYYLSDRNSNENLLYILRHTSNDNLN